MHHCYTTTALEGLEVSSLKDVVCFSTFIVNAKCIRNLITRTRVSVCCEFTLLSLFKNAQNTCRYYNVSPPTNPLLLTLQQDSEKATRHWKRITLSFNPHRMREFTFSAWRYQKINCLNSSKKGKFRALLLCGLLRLPCVASLPIVREPPFAFQKFSSFPRLTKVWKEKSFRGGGCPSPAPIKWRILR